MGTSPLTRLLGAEPRRARRRRVMLGDAARTGRALVGAPVAAVRHRAAFADVRAFCLFLGYPRSGHSLVGSLLSAHPEMVIAQELRVHRVLRFRLPPRLLYGMILDNDRRFTQQGRRWTGYDMHVPGQWQGRYARLRVVGDKRGGNTTHFLANDPHQLELLRARAGAPLRLVHVIRNPFDNIATIADRTHRDLDTAIRKYTKLARGVVAVRQRLTADELCDVHHEDLVAAPRATLSTLCDFLGVAAGDDYLTACAAIVHDRASRTRSGYAWTPAQREAVEGLCAEVPFLRPYLEA